MNEKVRKVVWTEKAVTSLNEHLAFLNQRSSDAAVHVKQEILRTARSLGAAPEIFQLDEFVGNETQNIRRFFRWNYRVVYQVFDLEVVILDIIHTSKNRN